MIVDLYQSEVLTCHPPPQIKFPLIYVLDHICGRLYDGSAQCDCWKYDLDKDLEVDEDIFPKCNSDMNDNC